MGKVGSRSVQRDLINAGIDAGHTHRLDRVKNPTPNDKYISPVRDPVARNLSAFFHNITKFDKHYLQYSVKDSQRLVDLLISKYPPEICLNWFENKIEPFLGIDVYNTLFNEYAIYDNKLLVFRIEDYNNKGNKYIKEFLNIDIKLSHIHRTVEQHRKAAPYYRWSKTNGVISQSYLEKVYNSRFARHFYSFEEIEEFINYWSKVPR
jgi:hypothetical protein